MAQELVPCGWKTFNALVMRRKLRSALTVGGKRTTVTILKMQVFTVEVSLNTFSPSWSEFSDN